MCIRDSYDIGRVEIDWSSDAGKMYDIQVSKDGGNWTTLYRQLKGYGNEVANIELYANARYVRMYGYTKMCIRDRYYCRKATTLLRKRKKLLLLEPLC